MIGRRSSDGCRDEAIDRPHRGREHQADGGTARTAGRGRAANRAGRSDRELGIPSGVIGASVLRPTIPGRTIAGPALTVRNILQRIDPLEGARRQVNRMAEFEAHNLAQPGDVLVIQGVPNMSNMGGISALTGKRQGEVGAIVQGGVRDIAHSRALDYPVWSSDITPVTGKWRLETVEINGPIQIGEVRVAPGDLVVADDTGVCFIPRDVVLEVLEGAEKKAKAEDVRCKAIDDGIPVPDISRATYGEKGK
jgi:4-hydroxy-4-methyl-2-oxoglutarate aldolase